VDLLVNNAGVAAGTSIWEASWADWEWVIDVNLWGVLHGLKIFVPIMLAQESEGHIINVASVAGLLNWHVSAPYLVTKHAVVALSEALYHNLAERGSKLKTSVLCPSWVKTRILEAERNRPAELQNEDSGQPLSAENLAILQRMIAAVEAGISPAEVADQVFDAIQAERFYILTHPEYQPLVEAACQYRARGVNPVVD
jgi:NADP-dependent 3-hydroxy acid dehydrogenase YdfG